MAQSRCSARISAPTSMADRCAISSIGKWATRPGSSCQTPGSPIAGQKSRAPSLGHMSAAALSYYSGPDRRHEHRRRLRLAKVCFCIGPSERLSAERCHRRSKLTEILIYALYTWASHPPPVLRNRSGSQRCSAELIAASWRCQMTPSQTTPRPISMSATGNTRLSLNTL